MPATTEVGFQVSSEQLSLVPSSDFLGPTMTFSSIAVTISVMVEQSSTETILPESEVLLLEHDLHYRNITKEVRTGNAHVGISLIFLILLVGVGVVTHIERLGRFCRIWHKVLYHLALFIGMQLDKFRQDVILLLAKVALLQNTAVHVLLFEVVFGSVSWLQPLDRPNVIPWKLQYEARDLAVRAVT